MVTRCFSFLGKGTRNHRVFFRSSGFAWIGPFSFLSELRR